MIEQSYKIISEKFKDNYIGNALLLNCDEIPKDYNYVGLWYVLDGNDKTSITTELYYSNETNPVKPIDFSEEIKENNFKQFNRFCLPRDKKWIWVTARIDNSQYCSLKMGELKNGKSFIAYKIIHNKGVSFEVLKSGIINGSQAFFTGIYVEDNTGIIDYKDAIIYLVFLKEIPPVDWNVNHYSFGVNGIPIINTPTNFIDNKKYSQWLGNKIG
jgi:hypothetical protein